MNNTVVKTSTKTETATKVVVSVVAGAAVVAAAVLSLSFVQKARGRTNIIAYCKKHPNSLRCKRVTTPPLPTRHTPGYTPGYTQGYTPGYTPGYTQGYTPGYTQGYTPGYADLDRNGFTISLNNVSPSGTGMVPAYQEVLRFDIAASQNSDVRLNKILFKINSTDNANSAWNTCANVAGRNFSLYNLTTSGGGSLNPSVDLDYNWSLWDLNGDSCNPSESPGYLLLTLPVEGQTTISSPQEQTIPAGSVYTYALYFDSVGASAFLDDSVMFTIVDEPEATRVAQNAIVWYDENGLFHNGWQIKNLPVIGSAIQF